MNLELKAEQAVSLVSVEWSGNGVHRLFCFPQFFQGSNFLKVLRNGLLKLCELLRTRIARRHHVPLHIKIIIESQHGRNGDRTLATYHCRGDGIPQSSITLRPNQPVSSGPRCERFMEDAGIASLVTTNTPLLLIRI